MPSNAEQLEIIAAEALEALALDLRNPKPNYSLDGQSVDRTTWRKSLWESYMEAKTLLQFEDPYELHGTGI